jgi:hypothetical protein
MSTLVSCSELSNEKKKRSKETFQRAPHHLTSSIHLYSANKKFPFHQLLLLLILLRTGEELQRQPLTGAYEGKISSCSLVSELLGESPVLSILQGGLNRYLGFSLLLSKWKMENCATSYSVHCTRSIFVHS